MNIGDLRKFTPASLVEAALGKLSGGALSGACEASDEHLLDRSALEITAAEELPWMMPHFASMVPVTVGNGASAPVAPRRDPTRAFELVSPVGYV